MHTCACSPPAQPFTDWSSYSLMEFSLPPIILPVFLPPFLSVTSPMSLIKIKSHLSRSKPLPKNQLPLGLLPSLGAFPPLPLIWVTPFLGWGYLPFRSHVRCSSSERISKLTVVVRRAQSEAIPATAHRALEQPGSSMCVPLPCSPLSCSPVIPLPKNPSNGSRITKAHCIRARVQSALTLVQHRTFQWL